MDSQRKLSRTASIPETDSSSNLGDSPLAPLRSFIPSHRDDLGGFQIEDKSLLDQRPSMESDSSVSYPSQEPSLLEQVRAGLSGGRVDVRKTLNTKKSHRDVTINFSLSSSPGSLNSTADLSLPRKSRPNVLKPKAKKNMTLNFTMNDTSSSCDNQENESPVLPIGQPKVVFKKPAAKKMSIRIDDDSDTSRVSNHDDSLPTLDPQSRQLPLRSSRSRATRDKNMTFDISLNSSGRNEESKDQASLSATKVSLDSSNEAEGNDSHPNVSGQHNDQETSMDSSGNIPKQVNDQTFITGAEAHASPPKDGARHISDVTFATAVDSGGNDSLSTAPINDHTFVVEPAPPADSASSSMERATSHSIETPMEVNEIADNPQGPESPAPTASAPNPSTPTPKAAPSRGTSLDAGSEVNDPNSVAQTGGERLSQPKESLTDPLSQSPSQPTTLRRSATLKRKKNKFSIDFTLSDTASNDSAVTSPNILRKTAEPLKRKRSKKISIAIQPYGDETKTAAQEGQGGTNEIDDDVRNGVDSPRQLVPVESSEANESEVSLPVISGKLGNPLKTRLGSNRVSIPYKCDESLLDSGSQNSDDGQRQVTDTRMLKDEVVVEVEEPLGKSVDRVNDDTIQALLPPMQCANPLTRQSKRNKFSIPFALEETVNGSVSSGMSESGVDARERSANQNPVENVSVVKGNLENPSEEPRTVSSETQSSDALSLRCSLDDIPRSSVDSDSFKTCGNISGVIPETNDGAELMQSTDGQTVPLSPDQSMNELHLELSLNGSLKYSGWESNASSENTGDNGGQLANISLESGGLEKAEETKRSASPQSPVLTAKNPLVLRRSKRGSRNVTVNSSPSSGSYNMSDLTTKLYKNPLKTRSRLNKLSIALPDQTESSVTEALQEAPQHQNEEQINDVPLGSPREISVSKNDNVPCSDNSPLKKKSPENGDGPSRAMQDDVGQNVQDGAAPEPATTPLAELRKTAEPNARPSLADPNVEQLRSSLEPPPPAHWNITKPSPAPFPMADDQELPILDASHPSMTTDLASPGVLSAGVAVIDEPGPVDGVVLSPFKEKVSPDSIDVGKGSGGANGLQQTTRTMQTAASSLHLHLTTLDVEAGDGTDFRSHTAVSRLPAVQEDVAMPMGQPDPKTGKPGPDVMEVVAEETYGGMTVQNDGARLSNQGATPTGELQLTAQQNILYGGKSVSISDVPTHAERSTMQNNGNVIAPSTSDQKPPSESGTDIEPPPPSKLLPTTDLNVIPDEDAPPEFKVPRKSKRKSVSFKPPSENCYHSPPPDHGSFQHQDADGRTQADNGYEFSRIQMTTDISEIQSSPGAKKTKRHFSSTPISKPKKAASPVQPPSLVNAQPTNYQFLVPSAVPVAKRVSIHPVPEIITPLRPDLPGPVTEDGRSGSAGGSGTSSYDLSCENSLEISAIPKETTAPKWGNLFHSTPLHRTKASTKRMKKTPEEPPVTDVEGAMPEEQPDAQVVNHSAQTSRNLRSRSKTTESISEPPSQGTSESGSLRRSARINRTLVPDMLPTAKSGGGKPVDGSPPDRISIQDSTIVSTRIDSKSRTRGSKARSNNGSAFRSYDSHRKMSSRRLFEGKGDDENKSSADAGYPSGGTESSPPISCDVRTTPQTPSTSMQNDDLLSPAETSIARSDQLSIPQTDDNVSLISDRHLGEYSDNDSVVSAVSSGTSNSFPSHVMIRQSFQSQLSSIRHQSKRHNENQAESHNATALSPKPRSKYAIRRADPALNLDLIYPGDDAVRKTRRKRTQPAPVKLYNPGPKWKKSKALYAWLKKKLKPTYGLRTNVESERLVIELENARVLVSQGYAEGALDPSIERLKRLQICSNELQLWNFFMTFMPFEFVREVVPMGGAFGKPFDPSKSSYPYDPI